MLSVPEILGGRVLIVDDQQANVLLLERMLAGAGYTSVSSTMDPRAVSALHAANRYDLILLDLQMPAMDGFEVMEALKQVEPEGLLSVLVITAQPGHKLRALQAGARDFVSKPFELPEVLARVRNLLEARLLHKALRRSNDELEQRVRERTADLQESYSETIVTMMRAVEQKDGETGAHVQRISHYCRALSRKLGMDEEFVDTIFFASPMHDIGKIGVPDRVLLKAGALSPEEWEEMKEHTWVGARILERGKSPYLRMGAEIALDHHERWDGGGYPNGKRGESIPLAARVMNICDVYDALRSKRPYKPAFDHLKAADVITRGDGRTSPQHFDPEILRAFKGNEDLFREVFEEFTE
jgi:putative two-component system response regulator